MIMSTPCSDFSFREPHAMDLRNSNTHKFALPLLFWAFHEMKYYVKVTSTHGLEISALE